MTPQLDGQRATRDTYDPLDLQLDELGATTAPVDAIPVPARRASRAWSSSLQASAFLLVGLVLGPQGFGLLGDSTLSLLDPVVPVALAVVGALVAFEIGAMPWIRSRVVTAACVQGLIARLRRHGGNARARRRSSSTTRSVRGCWRSRSASVRRRRRCGHTPTPRRAPADAQVLDVDAVLPIIVGGLVIAAVQEEGVIASAIQHGAGSRYRVDGRDRGVAAPVADRVGHRAACVQRGHAAAARGHRRLPGGVGTHGRARRGCVLARHGRRPAREHSPRPRASSSIR